MTNIQSFKQTNILLKITSSSNLFFVVIDYELSLEIIVNFTPATIHYLDVILYKNLII